MRMSFTSSHIDHGRKSDTNVRACLYTGVPIWFIVDSIVYRLCTLRLLWSGYEAVKQTGNSKIRPGAGYELDYSVLVNTLVMDTPWRMFLQVITLCGRPHNRRSVIYPSYTERSPVSRMSLWFNRLKRADGLVFFFFFTTATKSWWHITQESEDKDEQTVHLDFKAATFMQIRRLNTNLQL